MVKIMAKQGDSPWEEIDRFDTREEALEAMRKYRLSHGIGWRLRMKGE